MTLFSTEMVSKYHPDKFADQISDAILTHYLSLDPYSHVACECLVKDRTVVLGGEITSRATSTKEQHVAIVQSVARSLGYTVDQVLDLISPQSVQIEGAVNSCKELGAGDQGMMFGYACRGGRYHLPYGQELAIRIIKALEADISNNPASLLKGDAKTQVTTDLSAKGYVKPLDTVLISVCHKEGFTLEEVQAYVKKLLQTMVPEALEGQLLLNSAGIWTIGGPEADCGLTGRKIVCDQYGGYAPVGGGAFSGKDPTKVDRSASYMARRIAVDLVEKYGLDSCTVQLAYAIGKSLPVSACAIGQDKDGKRFEESSQLYKAYDLTPEGMIEFLGLRTLDYTTIAGGNHMIHFPEE
jgi:S-adenosylmethionine synthetase